MDSKKYNHYYESLIRKMQEADFVFTIKRGKIHVIKDRNGTTDLDISFSELFGRLLFNLKSKSMEKALAPFLEKIRLYETFE